MSFQESVTTTNTPTTWEESPENCAEFKKKSQVVIHCMNPFIQHSWNDKTVEMKNRLVVAKGTVAGDRVGVALGVVQGEGGGAGDGSVSWLWWQLHTSTHGTRWWWAVYPHSTPVSSVEERAQEPSTFATSYWSVTTARGKKKQNHKCNLVSWTGPSNKNKNIIGTNSKLHIKSVVWLTVSHKC